MIGLRNALITPKIRATAIRVSSFEIVDPAVSWMPGSTAVATASAAAETATRNRKRMGQSWHSGTDHTIGRPAAARERLRRHRPLLRPPEMDEEPPEVLGVRLDAVVERLDLFLLQEPEHPLLELPRALARDDLNERGLLRHGLVDDRLQGPVDVLPAVVDVVQVQLQLHDAVSAPGLPPRYAAPCAPGGSMPHAAGGAVYERRSSPSCRMISRTTSAGGLSSSTTITRSAGRGGSTAASWLSSSSEWKKWPCRSFSRATRVSRSTTSRKTIRSSGRPSRSWSR